MNKAVIDWFVPKFTKTETVNGPRGIDAQDAVLMWVIQDCQKCSERDKKIAQIILNERLRELEELM